MAGFDLCRAALGSKVREQGAGNRKTAGRRVGKPAGG